MLQFLVATVDLSLNIESKLQEHVYFFSEIQMKERFKDKLH